MSIPSIGLAELIILAGIAGLVMLIVAIVVVAIVRSRKKRRSDAHRPDEVGQHELEVAETKSRGQWKWIAVFVLLVLVVLPLFVVICGVLWVTPVRTSMGEGGREPTIQAVALVSPMATPLPALTASDAAPTDTLPLPQTSTSSRRVGPAFMSLDPHSTFDAFIIPPVVASLALLIGALVISIVLRRWPSTQWVHTDVNEDNGGKVAKMIRTRYVLLTLIFWVALSGFLILDLSFSVSLYLQFVAIYAAFWVLVGMLLLYGSPVRHKLVILGLFLVVVSSVRFIDWNSRKPFLRDFHRIKEGMTESQVDQVMSGYMKEYGGGPPRSHTQYEFDEQGEIATGWVTYRHTDEGWGNSDWGVVAFENSQVVQTRFLPD